MLCKQQCPKFSKNKVRKRVTANSKIITSCDLLILFLTSGVAHFSLALFLKMNVTLQEKEIFTSLSAARSLLEQKQHRPLLLVEDSALEDFTGTEL